VPAFPGAQGGGARAKGGRGGKVILVTNLNDSGPGSLRACVEATGARTCVFRVGGTIQLESAINIYNPYLTVAGQTAPGGGIQIRGNPTKQLDLIVVRTHDVVWRYTRLRPGANTGTTLQVGGAIICVAGCYNSIFDHNSLNWTKEDSLNIYSTSTPPKDLTFSWGIIAETLQFHPTAALMYSKTTAISDGMTDIDLHHNLFANNGHRQPLSGAKRLRFINNAVYNWYNFAAQQAGGGSSDWIGNQFKCGPMPCSGAGDILLYPGTTNVDASGTASMYVAGNIGPGNSNPGADNWTTMTAQMSARHGGTSSGPISSGYRRNTRLPAPASGIDITVQAVSTLQASLAAEAGASRRLACDGTWVANRDSVDARVVNEYVTGTALGARSNTIASEAAVGGFPNLAAGSPCPDGDADGIPDAWETARCGSATACNPSGVAAGGYTFVEHYLNGTTP
jgi:hypothetical protein